MKKNSIKYKLDGVEQTTPDYTGVSSGGLGIPYGKECILTVCFDNVRYNSKLEIMGAYVYQYSEEWYVH